MDRESNMDGVGNLLRGTHLFLVLNSSLVAQMVKNLPAMQETWVRSLEKISGEGNSYPIQYSCLANSMNRGAWWATVHGVTKTLHD